MCAEVQGDKGHIRGQKISDLAKTGSNTEAMWAVTLTKELWRRKVWSVSLLNLSYYFFQLSLPRDDAKTVSIVALACFHPAAKVQSAAIHFFLGDENQDGGESDDEDLVRPQRTVPNTTTHPHSFADSGCASFTAQTHSNEEDS